LVVLVAAFVSGFISNTIGTPVGRPVVVAHGVAGLGLFVLAYRKSVIARRSLGRKRRRRGWRMSLLMAVLVTSTVATGLLQATGTAYRLGYLTVMQLHIGGAVVVGVLLVLHYRQRPTGLRRGDLSRRTVLQAAGTTAAAGGVWLAWEAMLRATAAPGAARRFTGSHELGSATRGRCRSRMAR
jgi:hypothetical protein